MFDTLSPRDLLAVSGGMDPAAAWIMQHESSGNPRAGHLHASRTHSSAYGLFQLTKANRKRYMGASFESSDPGAQYAGAAAYVKDRYGTWANAKRFWQTHVDKRGHHWY